jgi:hypothetical protein
VDFIKPEGERSEFLIALNDLGMLSPIPSIFSLFFHFVLLSFSSPTLLIYVFMYLLIYYLFIAND